MQTLISKITIISSIILSYILFLMFIPVSEMPAHEFNINEGESIRSITNRLEGDGYIRSALIFRLLASFNMQDRSIDYGRYNINELNNKSLVGIYKGILGGEAFLPGRRLTIPEGFTTREIARRVSQTFNISEDEFYKVAKIHTGYLYPETYFFAPNSTSQDIIDRLKKEFDRRVGEISSQDLVLASIIEGEGKNLEDMKLISGILQNRINIGMPLQVDVAPETYKSKSVPKNPINNPGVNAITALRNPTKSNYLYYITGNDGNFYYAENYDKHKEYIEKYLR